MEKSKEYLGRMATAVKSVGGNGAAAKIMDKSVKSIERYKAGAEAPFEAMIRLCSAADISAQWLATGKDEVTIAPIEKDVHRSETIIQSTVAVKNYLDNNGLDLSPSDLAQAIILGCEIAEDDGTIDESVIKRLMNFKF